MIIEIPDDLAKRCGMNENDLRLEIAVALFKKNKFTLGQAVTISRISRWELQCVLVDREIPIHYDVEDLEKDMETLKTLI